MGSSSYRGIQTMRNWPGWPPRSARKRYVIVVGVSRTISRRGTTWILGMSDPNRLRNRVEARFLEEGGHFLRDLVEDAEAAGEDRSPDLDGARPRHDVLQGVTARPDSTDTDHRDVHLLADVVHGPHADRPDRGTAQAAVLVREGGDLQLRRDRHRLQCVDRHDAVGPAFLGGDRKRGDVLDIRGELREDGDVDDILHRAGEVPDRGCVLGDFGPEALRVRAGQIQLDRLDAVRRHLGRDGGVLFGVFSEDGADHDCARGVGSLDLMFVLDDARVREADRIQQAGIELDNRRVRIPFARLRTHALRDDGACACLIDAAHRTARLVEESGCKHRRVPKGDAGDLCPEVHHRRTEMTEPLKALGPRRCDGYSRCWASRKWKALVARIRFFAADRPQATSQGRDVPTDEAVFVAAPGNASKIPAGPARNTCTAAPYAGAPMDQLPMRIM